MVAAAAAFAAIVVAVATIKLTVDGTIAEAMGNDLDGDRLRIAAHPGRDAGAGHALPVGGLPGYPGADRGRAGLLQRLPVALPRDPLAARSRADVSGGFAAFALNLGILAGAVEVLSWLTYSFGSSAPRCGSRSTSTW